MIIRMLSPVRVLHEQLQGVAQFRAPHLRLLLFHLMTAQTHMDQVRDGVRPHSVEMGDGSRTWSCWRVSDAALYTLLRSSTSLCVSERNRSDEQSQQQRK